MSTERDEQQPRPDETDLPAPDATGHDADAATAPLPPQAAGSAAVPPSAPVAPAVAAPPAGGTAPARPSFWRRTWVMITAPILAAVLVLFAGVGIGWAASTADHRGHGAGDGRDGRSQQDDRHGSQGGQRWGGSEQGSKGDGRSPQGRQQREKTQEDPGEQDSTPQPSPTTTPAPSKTP